MDEQISIAHARDHITSGEYWLKQSETSAGYSDTTAGIGRAHLEASRATAHFTAAMAITNVLLADSDEWQGIPEADR